MHVQIEEQSPVKKRVVITIPAARVARSFDSAYTALSKRVKMPGFRSGKIPADVLRKRYGAQIAADVAQNLVNEGWRHALDAHKLTPVSEPAFDVQVARPGSDFHFSFTVEVPPHIELLPPSSFEVEKATWNIPEDRVEHELTHIAESAAQWQPVGDRDVAQTGDLVVADFEGFLDGVAFEGGKAEEAEIVLGSKQFIPGFEDALTGKKVGEPLEFEITFPEGYQAKHLAGRAVTFKAEIKDIKVKVIPAIDDDLAKEVGQESLEKLRQSVRDQMQRHWTGQATREATAKLREQIAAQYAFELPPSLVEGEMESRRRQIAQEASRGGTDIQEAQSRAQTESEAQRPEIERNLRADLVLDQIGEQEGIDVDDATVNQHIEAMARQMGQMAGQIRQTFRNANRRAALSRSLRHEKVLEFLLTKANVTTVSRDVPAHDHTAEDEQASS